MKTELHRCATKSKTSKTILPGSYEIFEHPIHPRGMVARRRATSPGGHQQPRAVRAESGQSRFSRLGKKSRAHGDSRTNQAAGGRTTRAAGFLFKNDEGSFVSRKT